MIKQKPYLHYLSLVGIIVLGAILRFTNLDLKPLWMDEVITSIFSLGKNYEDLPLDTVFPLTKLIEIFTYQSGITCPEIATNIASQSTHPPLFFCTMYAWLTRLQPLGENWIWEMRSLPAFFGVAAIFVIYWVNRIAFSSIAGIAAAACMAVSPFAVYLSQEARHYTLPMLLISLAILGLIQIQRDIFQSRKNRLWVWCYWIIANSLSLYVHYFCILALIAQIATLVSLLIWRSSKIRALKKTWLTLTLSTSAIAVSFFPWLLVMLNHSKRSETDWLQPPQHIAPLYQTAINWVLMVVAFPVEKQPLLIAIISGFLMLFFGIWIVREVFQGLKQLLLNPKSQLSTLTLLSFSIWVILEFFAIIYFLGKDITVVPRYNFIYYPSFCALLAASLLERERGKGKGGKGKGKIFNSTSSNISISYSLLPITLLIGSISCIFLLCNLVFQKPFQPELVAKNFNQEPSTPTLVVVAYSDYQDVALGLSFALAFQHLQKGKQNLEKTTLNLPMPEFAFFNKKTDFQTVLQRLSQINLPQTRRLNIWIVASGLRKRDFPQQVTLQAQSICSRDDKQYYRIGIPYQLYRCE